MTSQEMKKTLWEAADKLRAQMDAAEYKHLVLGLIFLKYVSDAFDERRREVAKLLADRASELFFTDDKAEQATAMMTKSLPKRWSDSPLNLPNRWPRARNSTR
jgi:type I restriction enzyme M protein